MALVATGLLLAGCSSSSSTPASTTTTVPADTTPLAWLTNEGRPWNGRLNADQSAIDAAGAANEESDPGAFFTNLASSCTRLLDDARKAAQLPKAPSTLLDGAWRLMARNTEAYASACLTLTQTRTSGDFANWNAALKTMDASNAALNTVVNQVRAAAAGEGG
jgi:hypothetical protein